MREQGTNRQAAKGDSRAGRVLVMLGLILAGEVVFALPFHITRFFRATFLDVFALSDTQLGTIQGIYGIVAMLAYFPGGPIADRYAPRKLLAASLLVCACGGLYMATIPSFVGACILWGFFGFFTIFLFWAPLLRATRYWGSSQTQGRAYGILEGGRGAIAVGIAIFATVGLIPDAGAGADPETQRSTLRLIIFGYTALTALAAVFVYLAIGDSAEGEQDQRESKGESVTHHVGRAIKNPAVWLQAVIIVCAYVCYKGFDNTGLWAEEGYGLERQSARWVVIGASVMRPVAAIAAGLFGDRVRASRVVLASFAVMLASSLTFAFATPSPSSAWLLVANASFGAIAIFGVRGVYFALFGEAQVPTAVTGTAVGFVSVVGYTPDIFVNYAQGRFLDASPGVAGHQNFYLFLASFALVGAVASLAFARACRRAPATV